MPKPRHSQISLDATPYYHCVSRCVRRAFLCGEDSLTGRSFEHRRGWIEERLLSLAEVFALDICAYAVMSNHTHVVLYVDRATAEGWSLDEVIERWHALFSGTALSQRHLRGERLGQAELDRLEETAEIWRERLMSVSWFMRCLNEHIARLANAEDECTGRFWEGRFKSQAILDEAALAACLAYVDLNPVRARLAETPERSDFTSAQRRIEALQATPNPIDRRTAASAKATAALCRKPPQRNAQGPALCPYRLSGTAGLDRAADSRGQAWRHRRRYPADPAPTEYRADRVDAARYAVRRALLHPGWTHSIGRARLRDAGSTLGTRLKELSAIVLALTHLPQHPPSQSTA